MKAAKTKHYPTQGEHLGQGKLQAQGKQQEHHSQFGEVGQVFAVIDPIQGGWPSGHAYGKSIRTVKTCVGSEFCRFGTQNSTQLGIELEHDLFNMWSPHKVKLAVSGCPRNCSEAGIKDVGIIGVDSGWEMYIGGNGGIKTEVAEFFVKLKTAEEVREYNGAFLQLYREEAFYLERTVHYLQRVGMEHIKKAVLEDPARRQALNERLQFSLSFEQDPWKERLEQPLLKKEFDVIPVKQLEVPA